VNYITLGMDQGKAFFATSASYTDSNETPTTPTFTDKTDTAANFDPLTSHTLLVQLVNNFPDNDFLRLWVDPDFDAGQGGLGAPDAVLNSGNMIYNSGSDLFDPGSTRFNTRFQIITANAASQSGSFGAYHLGTSFADVANPVPEPGTLLTFLAGSAFLMRRRR
ncbi:MAG: PEP-CTERM sorting domain-containing protein, partial [Verrucomicrobiales bacterium]